MSSLISILLWVDKLAYQDALSNPRHKEKPPWVLYSAAFDERPELVEKQAVRQAAMVPVPQYVRNSDEAMRFRGLVVPRSVLLNGNMYDHDNVGQLACVHLCLAQQRMLVSGAVRPEGMAPTQPRQACEPMRTEQDASSLPSYQAL